MRGVAIKVQEVAYDKVEQSSTARALDFADEYEHIKQKNFTKVLTGVSLRP